jgi:hypothetical protein
VGTVVRGKRAPWNTQVGFRRGLVGVVFVRKQSRMSKQRLGVGVEVASRVQATFRETENAGPPIHMAQSIVQLIEKIMSFTSSSPH